MNHALTLTSRFIYINLRSSIDLLLLLFSDGHKCSRSSKVQSCSAPYIILIFELKAMTSEIIVLPHHKMSHMILGKLLKNEDIINYTELNKDNIKQVNSILSDL